MERRLACAKDNLSLAMISPDNAPVATIENYARIN